MLQTQGYKMSKISKGDNDRRMFNKGIFCSPEFVTFYIKKKLPGELRATKCTFVEHSSGIISHGSFCKMLQTQGYKMYLC
jgi:hypothetical protein